MPEGDQGGAFFSGERDVFGLNGQAAQAEGVGAARRDVFLGGRVVAFEDDDWPLAGAFAPGVERSKRGLRRGRVAAGLPGQGKGWAEQMGETDVEFIDADEEVQHALVDAQAAGGEAGMVVDVDEAPAPQRALRCQGAPVRRFERGQGEAEGDPGPRRVAVGQGAGAGEFGIHFGAGAEQ